MPDQLFRSISFYDLFCRALPVISNIPRYYYHYYYFIFLKFDFCYVVGCLSPYPNIPLMFLMTGDECLNSAVTKRILRESVVVLKGDEGLLGLLLT